MTHFLGTKFGGCWNFVFLLESFYTERETSITDWMDSLIPLILAKFNKFISFSECLDFFFLFWKQACFAVDTTPPQGKIPPSQKVTFDPMKQFRCPSKFRFSWKMKNCIFYYWKHHLQPLGRGGAVKICSQTITEWLNDLITEVFVKEPN